MEIDKRVSEISDIILSSEDIYELQEIEIELQKIKTDSFVALSKAEYTDQQSEIKSRLTMITSLLGICGERRLILRDTNGRLNHNFRALAKIVLSPSLYAELKEMAHKPLSEQRKVLIKFKNQKLKR